MYFNTQVNPLEINLLPTLHIRAIGDGLWPHIYEQIQIHGYQVPTQVHNTRAEPYPQEIVITCLQRSREHDAILMIIHHNYSNTREVIYVSNLNKKLQRKVSPFRERYLLNLLVFTDWNLFIRHVKSINVVHDLIPLRVINLGKEEWECDGPQ